MWITVVEWIIVAGYAGMMYWLAQDRLIIYCGFGLFLILRSLQFFSPGHASTSRGIPVLHPTQIPDDSISLVKLTEDVRTALAEAKELETKLFTYESSSPILLKTSIVGDLITTIQVSIEEAFNGMVSLTIGDTADHTRFMASTDIDAGTIGLYQVFPNYHYTSSTGVYLYLSTIGTTTGSGRISLD